MATILVYDDDKDIVEAISIYLEQEGHQILKAYDGQQALLVLQKNEVDLLIIDVMMPKLDGIRATLKIREEHSLPIIILSAKSEDAGFVPSFEDIPSWVQQFPVKVSIFIQPAG